MAEKTAIAWTRSTFNPWIGCTKVGPGCDHCYAEALDKRVRYGKAVHWGTGVPRFRTGEKNWKGPIEWNRHAGYEKISGGMEKGLPWHTPGFWPVFCASLADVFDNEVPWEWRDDLWKLISATPNLSWLLVTKRIGNVKSMIPDWWTRPCFPDNVRLLITVCNQEEADRDIPKLLALPCKNGVSYEPALGPINWIGGSYGPNWLEGWKVEPVCCNKPDWDNGYTCCGEYEPEQVQTRKLEWIIAGGESTQGAGKARAFDREWAYSTIRQCKSAGVPCFVKQLGSNVLARNDAHGCDVYAPHFRDRAGADPAEWPEDLRVQEFPA